jgi:hypothetical protein
MLRDEEQKRTHIFVNHHSLLTADCPLPTNL